MGKLDIAQKVIAIVLGLFGIISALYAFLAPYLQIYVPENQIWFAYGAIAVFVVVLLVWIIQGHFTLGILEVQKLARNHVIGTHAHVEDITITSTELVDKRNWLVSGYFYIYVKGGFDFEVRVDSRNRTVNMTKFTPIVGPIAKSGP